MHQSDCEISPAQPVTQVDRPELFLGLTLPDLAIWLALILSIFTVYAQVGHFDFTNYDDPGYVTENAFVRAGLTSHGVAWAFTAVVVGNWLPVTLLSHMLDCELFGMNSGMHHWVNVLFHMMAAVLLYSVLRRLTRSRARSAFVAFVFAVHPLHVQSVAWIAERKDVLSAFFFFLALYSYVRYTESPSVRRYLLMLAPFALGLMSKPMLVTFPFILLLLDVWPLCRTEWPKTVREKLPLFALSAVASVVTYFVQKSVGAVQAMPLGSRIENALLSYVTYILQALWPTRLAAFYPLPPAFAVWQILLALVVLIAVSAGVVLAWRTRPYLAVGWLWYLGTLVPVIGLVQAGSQAHADRYTYLPLVGLSIMLAWGAADLIRRWPRIQPAIAVAAVLACVASMALSWQQTAYWRNTESLFQHAIDATGDNWLAEGSLGDYLMKDPVRRPEAVEHLEAALRLQPAYAEAHNDLGLCLVDACLCTAAIPHFLASLEVKPGAAQPLNNLGLCMLNSDRYADAIPYFAAALRALPDSPDVHCNLGLALSKIPGREGEAMAHYVASLRVKPNSVEAHYGLGVLLAGLNRKKEALLHLEAAERLHPDAAITRTIESLR